MKRTITIKDCNNEDKTITMMTDGFMPRFYRGLFAGHDLFTDMMTLNGDNPLGNGGMEILENVAYAMAMYSNEEEMVSIEEWLKTLGTFNIAEMLPTVMEMWNLESETQSVAKKK